jgi:glycyl-tRNA synthetase beta chain
MASVNNVLVELLCEELPPKSLKQLGEEFANGIFNELKNRQYLTENSYSHAFSTPRRLAVYVGQVLPVSRDQELVYKLMAANVALDKESRPTAALRKRLEKNGLQYLADKWPNFEDSPDQLFVRSDGKVDSVFLRRLAAGSPLGNGLQSALESTIDALPIRKVMTYQLSDGWTDVKFARPVHRITSLYGAEIVPVRVCGLDSNRITSGHRFQGEGNIKIPSADEYVSVLLSNNVIASFEDRRREIDRQLRIRSQSMSCILESDETYAPLLDEVTALVEMPTVYVGQFDQEFLQVPQECLILTMRANQKYFPLLDGVGKLTNKFLIVSNMRLDDPINIISGNERVIRPRLADARFFFDQDRKQSLESRLPKLASVVYHNKLGSQGERAARVAAIARGVAQLIDAPVEHAVRAARLAKADLVSDMVGEFPELQGTMGRYYALHDGESSEVADAIEDHYKPRFAGDALPRGRVGSTVSLADKLETLTGLFGIGQTPTGDKDPFALRRHALGILRIVIEQDIAVSLRDLLRVAFAAFDGKFADPQEALETFIYQRLEGYLRDQGYIANEVDAVLSQRPVLLHLVPRQLAAVRAFMQLPEAESLAAANKRVANILKKVEANGDIPGNAEEGKLIEAAERGLFAALKSATPGASSLYQAQDFTGYLKSFAVLKAPVDEFFDNVMVMADDPALRGNRLALLHDLRSAMNKVADISKLAG